VPLVDERLMGCDYVSPLIGSEKNEVIQSAT